MRNIDRALIPLVAGVLALTLMGCQVPAAAPAPTAAPKPGAEKPAAPTPKPAGETPTPKVEAPKAPMRMLMGTTSIGSSLYIYYVAEAKFLNTAVPEVNITVVESGGGVENISRLAKGEFQVALTSAGTAYQAVHAMGPWKDKPISDLRWLWIWSVGPRVSFVTEASGVTSLKELEGKKFNPGMRGSSTEKDFEEHMKILGYKPSYYRGGTEDAVNAIKSREIIGYHKGQAGFAADASTLDIKMYMPIRAIGYTEQEIAKIAAERPWDLWVTVKKDELWPGAPEIRTIGLVVGTGTMKGNIPNEVAYKMIKLLNEKGIEEIAAGLKFMTGWKYAEKTIELANFAIHPGAAKYLQELGFKLKPEQIAPEMK